ncbi:MAG: DUF58 domain-containing protein [Ferruginibacter sp.]|nr:DUF58 domain-containing protein [Cytophagales bacterium]
MTGYHQSLRRGAGMEFSQYKSYQPGDDLRQLDWKMFARSDRYYIREAEVDTGIAVRFVVDASASMGHREGGSDGVSKLAYARFLVAALAYLAHTQGDAVGLFVLTDEPEGRLVNLTPRHDALHLQRFWHQLERLRPAGRFPEQAVSGKLFAGKRQKELTVFVSDWYEREREISALLGGLNARKNEILCFHLMGRNETDFTYQGSLTFEDLETGQTVQVEATRLREGYQEKVRAFLRTTREEMRKKQLVYQLLTLDQPLDAALRLFLTNRLRL